MISIHAGQCGNQMGYCILDSLFDHLTHSPTHSHTQSLDEATQALQDNNRNLMNHFFRRSHHSDSRPGSSRSGKAKWTARSVCIDTEPKVIHDCISRADAMKKWFLDPKHAHYEYGGAGNNWAKGYQLCTGEFRDSSVNSIRIELEEADVSPTLLVIHSIGGGTGSGLGTKMSEEIYDEFPDVSKMNLAVMPYHFGEVVVQHYNSVLCMAKVASVTDAVLLFENEIAHELCVNMRGIARPTLYDINRAITAEIIPALIPKVLSSSPQMSPAVSAYDDDRMRFSKLLASRGTRSRYQLLSQDIAHLCSNPNYKFLNIKTTPQTSAASITFTYDSWKTIISSLQRMSDSGSFMDRKSSAHGARSSCSTPSDTVVQNVATSLILRGPDAKVGAERVVCRNSTTTGTNVDSSRDLIHERIAADTKAQEDNDSLSFSTSYPSWLNRNNSANGEVLYSGHVTNGYQRSACLISNGQAILPSLQRPMAKGANMFRSGAYVHQYESCGLETDDFVTAFRNLGSIINNYVDITTN